MKKIIYKVFALAVVAIAFTSCLKDDSMVLDPDKAEGNVVEFGNTGSTTSPGGAPFFVYTPLTLDPSVATSVIKASVRWAGAENVAPQDITVNLAAAPEAITAWNAAYPNAAASAKYNQLPSNAVTFPSTVTIKKGEKVANFDISVKASLLNASQSNVLGIKVASTSYGKVSGNFGTVIYNLPLKSIWDGKYTYNVTNTYGTRDGNIPAPPGYTEEGIELRTVGPNLLEVTYLAQTYSGYARYQFSGDNTTITGVVAFSGSLRASNIDEVVLVDPINRKFILKWTWLGRGTTETWIRTGDR
ncbi:DUF1735 domain-containing protein [Pedobacter sp. Du54]|uniref:DUF1735 domain-containing protein n=1 Tax=Pedobacter anseongensis TaxID=3133439 RepID=UPI003099C21A